MRRKAILGLGILFLIGIGTVVFFPAWPTIVAGFLRGEAFLEGRPTSFWIGNLKAKDPSVRKKAAEVLAGEDTDNKEEIGAALAGLLNDPDPNVRQAVGVALIKVKPDIIRQSGEEGVPALIETLRHADAAVRKAAAEMLGDHGEKGQKAIPGLEAGIGDSNPEVQKAVTVALLRIHPESLKKRSWETVPPLRGIILDPNSPLRGKATRILGEIGYQNMRETADRSEFRSFSSLVPTKSFRPTFQKENELLLKTLSAATKDPDAETRQAAMSHLLEIDADTIFRMGKEAVPALSESLRSKDNSTRKQSLKILGDLGPLAIEAVPELVNVAAEEIPDVSYPALEALARVGAETDAALEALLKAMKSKDAGMRKRAASRLGWISPLPDSAINALVGALSDGDSPDHDQRSSLETRIVFPESFDGPVCSFAENSLRRRKNAVQILTKALDHPDLNVRASAAGLLGRMGPKAKDAIPKLIELTKLTKEILIRKRAAVALVQIGYDIKPAIPVLIGILTSGDDKWKREAASVVGQIGNEAHAAIPALMKALEKTPSPASWLIAGHQREFTPPPSAEMELLNNASYALVEIGEASLPALYKALRDPNAKTRERTAYVLYLYAGRYPVEAKKALPALRQALKDDDESVRYCAAHAIANLGANAESALPELIQGLQGKDYQTQLACVTALEKMGETAKLATKALGAALSDKGFYVRWYAAKALVNIGPHGKTAIPSLIEATVAKDPDIRALAAEALGRMTPESKAAYPFLVKLLEDESTLVRTKVVAALGFMGPDAVPLLLAAMEDKERNVRLEAGKALARIKPPVQEFKKLLQGPWGEEVLHVLGQIGPAAVPLLIDAMEDKEWSVRFGATRQLGELGKESASAIPRLLRLTKDEDRFLRKNAAQAIWKINGDAQPLISFLKDELQNTEKDSSFRKADAMDIVITLDRDGKEVVPLLIGLLNDEKPVVRIKAATTIWVIEKKHDKVLPVLLEGLKAPESNIAARSARAIGKMGPQARAAMPELLKALEYSGDEVRHWVAVAIWKIEPKSNIATKALVQSLDGNWWFPILEPEQGPDPIAVDMLIEGLRHPEAMVRKNAAKRLGWFLQSETTAKETLPALKSALGDDWFMVRRAAVDSIRSLESRRSKVD